MLRKIKNMGVVNNGLTYNNLRKKAILKHMKERLKLKQAEVSRIKCHIYRDIESLNYKVYLTWWDIEQSEAVKLHEFVVHDNSYLHEGLEVAAAKVLLMR